MNIINDVKRVVPFKHLNVGDTFMICDKHYLYMKTMPMVLRDKDPINTVVLNDGAVRYFNDDEDVIVVECETRIVKEGW